MRTGDVPADRSEDGFGAGEERTLDLGALASLPEDIALCARIDHAIVSRTGEGATELQRLEAVTAFLSEDEEFAELIDRLRTLIDAGEAKDLERLIAWVTRDGEAGK